MPIVVGRDREGFGRRANSFPGSRCPNHQRLRTENVEPRFLRVS